MKKGGGGYLRARDHRAKSKTMEALLLVLANSIIGILLYTLEQDPLR